jgi:hypothetical protein
MRRPELPRFDPDESTKEAIGDWNDWSPMVIASDLSTATESSPLVAAAMFAARRSRRLWRALVEHAGGTTPAISSVREGAQVQLDRQYDLIAIDMCTISVL